MKNASDQGIMSWRRVGIAIATIGLLTPAGCRSEAPAETAGVGLDAGGAGGTVAPPASRATFAALMAQRDFEAALVLARETAARESRSAGAFLDLASAALATSRYEEALDAVRAGIRFEPERAGGYVLRGVIQEARGDLSEAERSWLEALERNPSVSEGTQARVQLAGVARARGAFVGEENWLRAALALTPDDTDLRTMLALCLVAQGKVDEARKAALDVVARDPRRFEVQRLLAALAWDRLDYREALERGEIAVRLNDGDEVATRLLEGAFYIVTATRLTCQHGARPWAEDALIGVLRAMEREFGMEGAASFVELDRRFEGDAGVQERVVAAAAVACGTAVPGSATP